MDKIDKDHIDAFCYAIKCGAERNIKQQEKQRKKLSRYEKLTLILMMISTVCTMLLVMIFLLRG